VDLNKFNSARGERTERLVVDTALRLFREQGYDRTTMRAIAAAAGLSAGNAYYYFPSKQHLVQHFYAELQDEHRRLAQPVLARTTSLSRRLAGVLHAGIDALTPYHAFASSFIKVAIQPGSPLSPFSPESTATRVVSVELFRDVLTGSAVSLDERLRAELPELLWLAYLGLVLYWVHDPSPGQAKTRQLIDQAAPLLVKLLRMTRLPVLRSATTDVLTLLRAVRP
jgi:AcrR family transcriptional regulator